MYIANLADDEKKAGHLPDLEKDMYWIVNLCME
jgi:hypothetical protein